MISMTIDTTNMCSHLQKKLFEPNGAYYPIWLAMQQDEELTAAELVDFLEAKGKFMPAGCDGFTAVVPSR